MEYDQELEHRLQPAVSALNTSRGAYAGGWHLYTREDLERNVARVEALMEETRDNLLDLERVYVDLLARHRAALRG
jgi:hypothetical protein